MKNSKQPAFAVSKEMCEMSEITEYPYGLTKREYFAGLAMQGMFSQTSFLLKDTKELAEVAIKCADELLKQLEKTT